MFMLKYLNPSHFSYALWCFVYATLYKQRYVLKNFLYKYTNPFRIFIYKTWIKNVYKKMELFLEKLLFFFVYQDVTSLEMVQRIIKTNFSKMKEMNIWLHNWRSKYAMKLKQSFILCIPSTGVRRDICIRMWAT